MLGQVGLSGDVLLTKGFGICIATNNFRQDMTVDSAGTPDCLSQFSETVLKPATESVREDKTVGCAAS